MQPWGDGCVLVVALGGGFQEREGACRPSVQPQGTEGTAEGKHARILGILWHQVKFHEQSWKLTLVGNGSQKMQENSSKIL
jgi:hypothetical protein